MIVKVSTQQLFRFKDGHIPSDNIKAVSFCVSSV